MMKRDAVKRGLGLSGFLALARVLVLTLGAFFFSSALLAETGLGVFEGDRKNNSSFEEDDAAPWQENAVELPPYPKDEDFYSFYVSTTTVNRFYVDTAHIALGSDGVVRYALLVITPAGVRNLSYEGMRCQSRERRLYAIGRPDNRWTLSRGSRWVPVREATANRQYAALFFDFFCPDRVIATRGEDVVRAIKKQGEPLREQSQ